MITSSSELVPKSQLAEFCESRGLDLGVATQAGLRIEDEGNYEGWLAIPYPHLTGIWGTRYRRLDDGMPKYMDMPGAELHLYNPAGLGPHSDEVWFTEGELDTLILLQYGVPAIGLSGATKYAHPLFQQAWSLLFAKARIVIATDNDGAGNKAAQDIASVYPHAGRFEMPDGYDINDWHLEDPDALASAIEAVRS